MSLSLRSNKKESRKFCTQKRQFFKRVSKKPIVMCESGGIICSPAPLSSSLRRHIDSRATRRSKSIKDTLFLSGDGRYKVDLSRSPDDNHIFKCQVVLSFKHQTWVGSAIGGSAKEAFDFALDHCRRKFDYSSAPSGSSALVA